MDKGVKSHARSTRGGGPGPLLPASIPRGVRSQRVADESRSFLGKAHHAVFAPPRTNTGVFDFLATVAGNLLGGGDIGLKLESEIAEVARSRTPEAVAGCSKFFDACQISSRSEVTSSGEDGSPHIAAKSRSGSKGEVAPLPNGEVCHGDRGKETCSASVAKESSDKVQLQIPSSELIFPCEDIVADPGESLPDKEEPSKQQEISIPESEPPCDGDESMHVLEPDLSFRIDLKVTINRQQEMPMDEPDHSPGDTTLPSTGEGLVGPASQVAGEDVVKELEKSNAELQDADMKEGQPVDSISPPTNVNPLEEGLLEAIPLMKGNFDVVMEHAAADGEKAALVVDQGVEADQDGNVEAKSKEPESADASDPAREEVKMEVDEGTSGAQGPPPPLVHSEPNKKPKSGIRSKRRRADAEVIREGVKELARGFDPDPRRIRHCAGRSTSTATHTANKASSSGGMTAAEKEAQMLADAQLAAALAEAGGYEPPAAAAMRRSVLRMSMHQGQDSPHATRPSTATTPKSLATTPKSPASSSRAVPPVTLPSTAPLLPTPAPAAAQTQPTSHQQPQASAPNNSVPLRKRPAEEQQVKVLIKSFEVPELTVTLPNSATVASLKKAVTDAATTLLGGGLRVRVMMQGRKVADEAATLAQCGIQRGSRPDSLGFMLEPMPPVGAPATNTGEDPLLVLSQAINQISPRVVQMMSPALTRKVGRPTRLRTMEPTSNNNGAGPSTVPLPVFNNSTSNTTGVRGRSAGPSSPHPTRVAASSALAAIRKQAEDSRRGSSKLRPESAEVEAVPASSDVSPIAAAAGAIVLHAGLAHLYPADVMAIVPIVGGMKKRPGIAGNELMIPGKRRIRRPFSVGEVEALVCAVENLGTGRWRDVKLRAFANAKHRTYVDLKDKWKTLVHTAQIAPHQRRGEPVPQELLERVTKAHEFWTAVQLQQQQLEQNM